LLGGEPKKTEVDGSGKMNKKWDSDHHPPGTGNKPATAIRIREGGETGSEEWEPSRKEVGKRGT